MEEKLKILLAEDNSNDVKLLDRELKKEKTQFEMRVVDSEPDFRREIENFKPDIIISDYSMPVFDGMSALRIKKEICPEIPFIIVTGSINEETAVICLKAGADDYVIKEQISQINKAIKTALNTYVINREIKEAEEALIESEEKYRTLVENLAIGVYQIAPDGKILEINPAMRRIIGFDTEDNPKEYNPEMLKNYTSWDFYPDRKVRESFLESIRNHGEIRNIEMQIFNIRKELIWVSITAKGRFDENGILLFIDGVLEDISARKAAEAQLIEAKEKAEEMNRLKSNFLANMSHELRTPMVGILGFSEILSNDLENEEMKNFSKSIYKSGKRLLNTLNLILDLSRIEANKQDLVLMECNVSNITKDLIMEYSLLADNKGIYIKTEIKDNAVFSRIDERIFRSIIGNLIDNAIKYTNEGGVTAIVEKEFEDNTEWAVIRIKDTGIGIPGNYLQTIFDEFRQVSEGWSRSYEGTGLGLTIAKKFTDLLKGKISVESKLNTGSEFKVKIPSVKSTDYKTPDENKVRSEKVKTPAGGKDNFLLIDDDRYVNDFITKIFTDIRHSYAESEDTALSLLMQKKYSLILLDINLGAGVEGIHVLKKIKAMDGYADVPVVAVTAYAMVKDRERFLKEGFDDYIPKPFDKMEIQNMVHKYLGKK